MSKEEKILEMHLGSDFYLVKENGMLKHIIAAMREHTSQFKTVEEPLRNLLAILHRDGGHYAAKHGLKKAIEDASELMHKEWIPYEFKTVEPEKRAELLKEIMDTDQEHGMYGKYMPGMDHNEG